MTQIEKNKVNTHLLTKVFMDATDPILIEDLHGIVVDMNLEAERSYGWSRKELIGKPIKTIVPFDRHKQADELLERCREGKGVRNVEGLRWDKSKTIIPVLITLSLLKDEAGKPTAVVTFVKDISRQKKLEEKYRRMSKVFMDATVPILIEDLDGIVIDMNNEAKLAYGWSHEDLVGKPIKTIVPPERYKEADDLLRRSKKGERVKNIEGLRWNIEKKIIPVLLTLSVLKDDNNHPIGIATIAKDISKLKAAEEKISLTQDVTIESMGTLAEYRDPETGGHIKRTRGYVKILAAQLKDHPKFKDALNDETIELLYKSAPLHDIGKVGIPDNILLKPGKLTDEGAHSHFPGYTAGTGLCMFAICFRQFQRPAL
ncbi:MAG: PAS domain S-box protein [Desulfobacter sp.]|nr:PAS domain S-box protein [Desulfobacter sp.]